MITRRLVLCTRFDFAIVLLVEITSDTDGKSYQVQTWHKLQALPFWFLREQINSHDKQTAQEQFSFARNAASVKAPF